MPTKINTPFVAALVLGLAVIGGLSVVAAYFVISKDGAEYEALGDTAMEAGELEDAVQFYGSAVAHDTSNLVWLDKWTDALRQAVPEGERAYQERFRELQSAIREAARVRGTDIASHAAFIEMFFRQVGAAGWSSQSYEAFEDQVDETLRFFSDPDADEIGAIRRYRGMAAADLASRARADEDLIELARADLELALSADPADQDAVFSLWLLDIADGRLARRDRRVDEADELDNRAVERLREFSDANPDAALAGLQYIILESARLADQIRRDISDAEARRATLDEGIAGLRDRFERHASYMHTAPITAINPRAWERLVTADRRTLTQGLPERSVAILRDRAGEDPTRFRIDRLLARTLQANQEFEEALAVFGRLADRWPQEVSIDGLLLIASTVDAVASRAETASQLWETATSEQQRDEAEAIAVEAVEDLRARVGAESPAVTKAEARLAFISGNLEEAQRKILAYRDSPQGDDDVSTHWLLGQIAYRRDQLGTAEDSMERVLEMRPGQVGATSTLAGIKLGLRKFEEARRLAESVLVVAPNNQAAQTVIRRLDVISGEAQVDDPVQQALLEAERLAEGDGASPGDVSAAIERLAQASEELDDPRISVARVRLLGNTGRADEARAVLAEARTTYPDNVPLQRLDDVVNADDPTEAIAQQLREADGDELEKALELFRLYVTAGRIEDARSALSEIGDAGTDDDRVLDARLGLAIVDNDMEAARAIADTAARNDVDGVGGRTYRARVLSLEGEPERAVDVMVEAAQLRPTSVEMWELLGRYQNATGDRAGAIDSLQRALSMDPTQVDILRTYIGMLAQERRYDDALAAARESNRLARADRGFMELWIRLESDYGSRDVAIAQREQFLVDYPTNRENAILLAGLYMDAARWDDAQALIDELRQERDDLDVASLAARWEADQGDLNAASVVFSDYIVRQDLTELTAEPFIVFGRFMVSRGVAQVGLRALEDGRDFQDPEAREADLSLAQSYLDLGRFEAASELLRSLLDDGLDREGQPLRLGLAESLLLSGRADEASSVLADLDAEVASQPGAVLLRARVAAQQGASMDAMELFDEAVAASPEDPLVYTERARYLAGVDGREQDALADVDTAIELRPTSISARMLRAAIYRSLGRDNDMLADLIAAVRLNPDRRELRGSVIEELITRERFGDAVGLARELFAARPGELRIIVETARSLARNERWNRAAELYELGWRETGSLALIPPYVNSLVRQSPPDLPRGRALLREISQDISGRPELLLARAQLSIADNRVDDAERDASAAFDLYSRQPNGLQQWFVTARSIFEDNARLVDFLRRAEPRVADRDRAAWMRGNILLEDEATRENGRQLLNNLLARSSSDDVRRESGLSLGTHYYTLGEYDRAAEIWTQTLGQFPDDWEILNNLAYVAVRHTGDYDLALTYATQATERNPESANAWDTLGLARLASGDIAGAEAAFEAGLERTVPTSAASVALRIHMAQVRLEQDRRDEAAEMFGAAEALARALGAAAEPYQTELDELREALGVTD